MTGLPGRLDSDVLHLEPEEPRSSSSVWPAAGLGSRGRIPRERNLCLAERAREPGWTLPLPAVPREGTARLHATEEDSRRFQATTEARVIPACSRAVAHFSVAIAEGAPVRRASTLPIFWKTPRGDYGTLDNVTNGNEIRRHRAIVAAPPLAMTRSRAP